MAAAILPVPQAAEAIPAIPLTITHQVGHLVEVEVVAGGILGGGEACEVSKAKYLFFENNIYFCIVK